MKKVLAMSLAALAVASVNAAPISESAYVGVTGGSTFTVDSNYSAQGSKYNPLKADFGGRFGGLLGYQFNENIALEANLDQLFLKGLKHRATSVGAGLKLNQNVGIEHLDLFGKLGAQVLIHEEKGKVSSTIAPQLAAGIEYAISPELSLRVGYEYLNRSTAMKEDVHSLVAGVVYSFGKTGQAPEVMAPEAENDDTLMSDENMADESMSDADVAMTDESMADESMADESIADAKMVMKKVSVSEKDVVLFDFNKAELNPQAKALVSRIATEIKDANLNNLEVRVKGHADRLGSDSVNAAIANKRAFAVADLLRGNPYYLNVVGIKQVGSADPVVYCDNATLHDLIECLAPNRRVDIEWKGTKEQSEMMQ